MSNQISVLIAEDNKELCYLLSERINKTGDMRVIAAVSDGKTAAEMIRKLEPDVVVLDIIMPKLDGLGVLESIACTRNAKRPVIIAATTVGSENIVTRAMELGADYYIMKPFEISVLIDRIRQIYAERKAHSGYSARVPGSREQKRAHKQIQAGSDDAKQPDMSDAVHIVTELIKCIGVTPNLAGYNFLREAVLAWIEQPDSLRNVSGNIYTMLAQKHNTKVRIIDRAIRCALISAQKKTKYADDFMQTMKESIMINNGKRPNSSQVIAFLAKTASKKLAAARARQYREKWPAEASDDEVDRVIG